VSPAIGASVTTGASGSSAEPARAALAAAAGAAPPPPLLQPSPLGPEAAPRAGIAALPGHVSLQWSGPTEAKLGETIELKLALTTATGLRGIPLDLVYDKQRLELIDVVEGNFFKRDGAATSFSKSLDAAGGRARIGILRNQASVGSGQGELLVLRLKAIAAGAATVRLEGAQPISLDAAPPNLVAPAPWAVLVR
jgi:general secretion pathway protein D